MEADGGCGGSSASAVEALKLGRGSGVSGGGRRAAAAPNMHSLATAALPVSGRESCSSCPQPTRSRPPSSPRLAVAEPAPTFLAGQLPRPLTPRSAFFSGPGAWSRGWSASLAARTGHSLIHFADQQFQGASCVLGVGGGEGTSAVRLTLPVLSELPA
ncbi:hypothetical protein J1605_013210 [Eschrichtius robustus]|uniref:Uncharacterized protein n=1 Tax=Eschrichtius robustus TaxID=9764 RepID=A0AB34GFU6_ESCRO|nr:hypothetical protein J1605_013210 [Eschrichtius robustus]